MNNLKVIENELVPVYETSTGEKVVYGTELHAVLEVKSKFADWVKNRIEDCEAIENEDYQSFSKILEKGGRPQTEYIIKLDTAKEMAMLERNDKGKQVRRYFIEIEKRYKNNTRPLTPTEQIQLIAQGHMEVVKKIDSMEERVDKLEYDIPLYGSEADELCGHVKRKGVQVMGGKESNSYKDNKIRKAVYTDIYNQIKREFGLYDDSGRYTTYKSLKRKYIGDAHEFIDCYELPTCLAEQIDSCNAQMRMAI